MIPNMVLAGIVWFAMPCATSIVFGEYLLIGHCPAVSHICDVHPLLGTFLALLAFGGAFLDWYFMPFTKYVRYPKFH
jgi:hypothetical protein